ncbi:hypothetical protein [Methylobacterium dankookense]|uniref:Uncharacterized protein n=1 Tax=Methylobacterium dankookense TaxID=560405 RepID=A0A564FU30_9HYPH|nr:hypothetical protein [Methylobacterium dankookense]GJD55309.1 hypothetical protein IFDJLNFL_1193 [Methylobacterium dankookense]VUF11583.1 hypothetical protein MTDSW087_01266 [Methylobacterium dankookense]
MVRIEATRRPATAQGYPTRDAAAPAEEPGRAVAVLPAAAGASDRAAPRRDGRPQAGFVAQLIVSADPSLVPSRSERARRACALYDAAARQVA